MVCCAKAVVVAAELPVWWNGGHCSRAYRALSWAAVVIEAVPMWRVIRITINYCSGRCPTLRTLLVLLREWIHLLRKWFNSNPPRPCKRWFDVTQAAASTLKWFIAAKICSRFYHMGIEYYQSFRPKYGVIERAKACRVLCAELMCWARVLSVLLSHPGNAINTKTPPWYVAYRYSGYCAMMEQRFEAISSSERIRVSARIVYVLCRDVRRHDSRWRLRSTAAFMFVVPGDNQPHLVNKLVPQSNLPCFTWL